MYKIHISLNLMQIYCLSCGNTNKSCYKFEGKRSSNASKSGPSCKDIYIILKHCLEADREPPLFKAQSNKTGLSINTLKSRGILKTEMMVIELQQVQFSPQIEIHEISPRYGAIFRPIPTLRKKRKRTAVGTSKIANAEHIPVAAVEGGSSAKCPLNYQSSVPDSVITCVERTTKMGLEEEKKKGVDTREVVQSHDAEDVRMHVSRSLTQKGSQGNSTPQAVCKELSDTKLHSSGDEITMRNTTEDLTQFFFIPL